MTDWSCYEACETCGRGEGEPCFRYVYYCLPKGRVAVDRAEPHRDRQIVPDPGAPKPEKPWTADPEWRAMWTSLLRQAPDESAGQGLGRRIEMAVNMLQIQRQYGAED